MILQRYVLQEYLRGFAMVFGGLTVIYFSTRFATYLGQAADGRIAPAHILQILSLKMLVSLRDLIPMSLFLGIFAAIIRLQRDSELVAMRAAGVHPGMLLIAAAKLGVIAALLVGTLTLYAEPRIEELIARIRDQTENDATIAGVKAGRFKELSGGKRVFYAEKVGADSKVLEQTFVQMRTGADVGLMRADQAQVETETNRGDRFAVFLDGVTYAGKPGALDYVVTNFGKYALRIEAHAPTDVSDQVNYMKSSELLRYRSPGFRIELQWRLAKPIGALLLPALAVMIALCSNGYNWYLWLLTAVAGYFGYSNLLGVGKALMLKSVLPTAVGLWLIHSLLLALLLLVWWLMRRPLRGRVRPAAQPR
ncbi:MAG: LPS export ABC transporter permease LptF [Gammaproteobacteria bacterium]|nr:LPS export ABC transporter permease LptF [Gammaproteobacteria bacterium]